MMGKLVFASVLALVGFVVVTNGHPTMYKYNDNNKLEPDLIPVSSTVIPLPVYKVSYGVNVAPYSKDEKVHKPQGPITLLTSANYKKKPVIPLKSNKDDFTSVKQVTN